MRFFPALAAALALTALPACSDSVLRLTPTEAAARIQSGEAVLVDVREPAEWNETGVAAPALLLAKSDHDGDRKHWAPFLAANRGRLLIFYCRSGNRSGKVAAALAAEGYRTANSGAFTAWRDAGLPVRRATAPAQ